MHQENVLLYVQDSHTVLYQSLIFLFDFFFLTFSRFITVLDRFSLWRPCCSVTVVKMFSHICKSLSYLLIQMGCFYYKAQNNKSPSTEHKPRFVCKAVQPRGSGVVHHIDGPSLVSSNPAAERQHVNCSVTPPPISVWSVSCQCFLLQLFADKSAID